MSQFESENRRQGLAEELSDHLGYNIQIKKNGEKGKVEIEYCSADDLARLVESLKQCR